jgi:hypothetical protein
LARVLASKDTVASLMVASLMVASLMVASLMVVVGGCSA